MNSLEVVGLKKTIKGVTVLENINLSLTGGNVYAFQGENGCGKTMLFRVLSGLSKPTEGKIIYNGELLTPKSCLPKTGIILENASLFPQFTAYQNLLYLAQINNHIGPKKIEEALRRVGLDPKDNRTVRKFSLGMKKRLVIAQAIMEAPDFLFLDEPTNAIDTSGVELVHKIIREEAQRGAVVLMASHIAQDVSGLADVCYRMEGGRICYEK